MLSSVTNDPHVPCPVSPQRRHPAHGRGATRDTVGARGTVGGQRSEPSVPAPPSGPRVVRHPHTGVAKTVVVIVTVEFELPRFCQMKT